MTASRSRTTRRTTARTTPARHRTASGSPKTKITRHELITQRLMQLRAEHAEVLAETIPETCGDVADRATNVDAYARLAMLDEQIADVERELADAQQPKRRHGSTVAPGDVVTVNLGDGPETFLFAPAALADAGMDVVTPDSPLGRALVGARIGSTISYAARDGKQRTAEVIAAH